MINTIVTIQMFGFNLKKNMKKISYLVIVVILFIQFSCKKDTQEPDDFEKYDNYFEPTSDTTDCVLTIHVGGAYSSVYFPDNNGKNDSIWICNGTTISENGGTSGFYKFGFYIMKKLAVKDLEEIPDPDHNYHLGTFVPTSGDLLKLFQPGQELKLSQTDLPWIIYKSPGQGIVFTWGTQEEYRSNLYEELSNRNKSSCRVVKSKIIDRDIIKVELLVDIYLKHRTSDKIVHIENEKVILTIFNM